MSAGVTDSLITRSLPKMFDSIAITADGGASVQSDCAGFIPPVFRAHAGREACAPPSSTHSAK